MESINVPENGDNQQIRKGKFQAPLNYGKLTLETESLKIKKLAVVGSDGSKMSYNHSEVSAIDSDQELELIKEVLDGMDEKTAASDDNISVADDSIFEFDVSEEARTKIKRRSSVQMDNQPIIWNLDLKEVLDSKNEKISPVDDTISIDDDSSPSFEIGLDALENDIKSTPSMSRCSPLIKECYIKMDNQPINWNLEKVVLPSGATELKYTRYKCFKEENIGEEKEDNSENPMLEIHDVVQIPQGKWFESNISDKLEQEVDEKTYTSHEDEVEEAYSPNSDTVKVGKRFKRQRHSKQFIEDALKMCDTIGVVKTAKMMNVSRMNLTRWRKKMGKESQKKRIKHSTGFKKEVLKHYSQHGSPATKGKYDSVDGSKISKWKKQYGVDPVIFSERERYKSEVLVYCKEKGLKAASDKFKVPLPTIWDWKAKEKKKLKNLLKLKKDIVQGRSKDLKNEMIKEYSNELKNEIVAFYKEHGSKACEVKFKVPRQTIRNWAVNMGQATIGEKRVEEKKLEALQLAKKEGVQKAMNTYPVKRATLYHWAKNMNAEIRDGENNSLEVSMVKEGQKKKLVFGRVEKPKIVKEKKPRITKPKKVKPTKPIEEVNSVELPEWAASFIKKAKTTTNITSDSKGIEIPGLQIHESLLTSTDFETINCDIFSMTIPVVQTPLSDTVSSQDRVCSDSSSESEYECNDYSDFSFPFFSPSLHQNVSTCSASLGSPTRPKKRRSQGQNYSA